MTTQEQRARRHRNLVKVFKLVGRLVRLYGRMFVVIGDGIVRAAERDLKKGGGK